MDRFGWQDFTPDESTDAIPDKYVLTVGTVDAEGNLTGDEVFTIVHRASPEFPIDGPLAEAKRDRAIALVNMLNESASWINGDPEHAYAEAFISVNTLADNAGTVLDTLA